MTLFTLGALTFAALLRGCLHLRRAAREGLRPDPALLTQSPLAPGISVLTSPADASVDSREFVRRLVDQQYRPASGGSGTERSGRSGSRAVEKRVFRRDPRRLLLVERKAGPADGGHPGRRGGSGRTAYRLGGPGERVRSRPFVSPGGSNGGGSGNRRSVVLVTRPAVARLVRPVCISGITAALVDAAARDKRRSRVRIAVPQECAAKTDGFEDGPAGLFSRIKGRIAFAPDTSYRLKTPGSWAELRRMAQRDRRWFPAAIETVAYPVARSGGGSAGSIQRSPEWYC